MRTHSTEQFQTEFLRHFDNLEAFLASAEKRLPTAAAIARDRGRKRTQRAKKSKRRNDKANTKVTSSAYAPGQNAAFASHYGTPPAAQS